MLRNGIITVFIGICCLAINYANAESLLKIPEQNTASAKIIAMLTPRKQAVLASQFTGEIDKITVKPGEHFKKDSTLVAFNCKVQQAELDHTRVDLKEKAAHLAAAKKLDALKSISHIEVQKAAFAYEKAKLHIGLLEAKMDQCFIKAPYDGKVVDVYANANEDVTPGKPLLKIISSDNLEIKFFAPSNFLAWLKIGTPFKVHFNEINKTIDAHVTKIGAHVDTASQTVYIYGNIDNYDSRLVSGMSGDVIFEQQEQVAKT